MARRTAKDAGSGCGSCVAVGVVASAVVAAGGVCKIGGREWMQNVGSSLSPGSARLAKKGGAASVGSTAGQLAEVGEVVSTRPSGVRVLSRMDGRMDGWTVDWLDGWMAYE